MTTRAKSSSSTEKVVDREASVAPPPLGPIALNAKQEDAVKTWAADDRLWTTQDTVEFNLRTFARQVLAYGLPDSQQTTAYREAVAPPPPQEGESEMNVTEPSVVVLARRDLAVFESVPQRPTVEARIQELKSIIATPSPMVPPPLWADAENAAAEAGFGHFDDDCTPAKVIRTLASANNEHEAQIIQIEQALGGCRPPLVEGSRVGNMLAYIERLREAVAPPPQEHSK